MLYDEPTTGLDPVTSRDIIKLMLDMQDAYHMSSVIISHDLQCVHAGSRIIALINGINYAEGTYAQLSKHPDQVVSEFFK